MAKPTTGRVQPVPEPDPEQVLVDTIMTAIFTGLCLIVAVILYGTVGGVTLAAMRSSGRTAAMIVFAVALAVTMAVIALLLRRFADPIRARSNNLYRGMWVGSSAALVILVLLYFLPWIAFPRYCPPGAICG